MTKVLANYEQNFPGFERTFYRALPLFQFSRRYIGEYMAQVIPLLQPITFDLDSYYALDARACLEFILLEVEGIDDAEERLRRLKRIGDDLGWNLVWEGFLEALLEIERDRRQDEYSKSVAVFLPELWRITHGDMEEIIPEQAALYYQKTFSSGFNIRLSSIAVLEQKNKNGQIFIERVMRYVRSMWNEALIDDHSFILILEAIRQQLLAKRGIYCPFYQGDRHCRCCQEFRDPLSRVAWLAKEGVFGPGEWVPLACRR